MKWFQTVVVAMLLTSSSIGAQVGSGSGHWVGTWATAEVGRPQTPPPPAPAAVAQPPQGQPPAPAAPPAPFLHFNNQTLRQIVRTSIGGNRVRIVLSNTFGTAPLTIGAAHVALRDRESAIAAGIGSRVDVQRAADHHDSVGRSGVQRSGGSRHPGAGRSGGRHLPAW